MNLRQDCQQRRRTESETRNRNRTESRRALRLALPFTLKPMQEPHKDVSDRIRKWNVYSEAADKWSRRRRWRALAQTAAFTYRRAAANIKQCNLCTLQSNLPIYTSTKPDNSNSAQPSDQQFDLSFQTTLLLRSVPMISLPTAETGLKIHLLYSRNILHKGSIFLALNNIMRCFPSQ